MRASGFLLQFIVSELFRTGVLKTTRRHLVLQKTDHSDHSDQSAEEEWCALECYLHPKQLGESPHLPKDWMLQV